MADSRQNKDRAVPDADTDHETSADAVGGTDTDRIREEHERRRRDEPAAAALEADAEAGAGVSPTGAGVSPSGAALRSGVPDPAAPSDPVPAAEAAHRREEIAENERRAGPGDAGATDRPTPLPRDKVEKDRRSGNKTMIWIAVAVLVVLLLVAIF